MAEKLQVAVVGVGGIAGAHMPGWKASQDAELAAGCDLNAEVLAKWGAEHGVEKLYTDIEDLWRDESIDIVDICTPNRYHAPLSIAALKAGKHVMCEKPLAPTPGEVRQMIAARDEAGDTHVKRVMEELGFGEDTTVVGVPAPKNYDGDEGTR